MYGPEQVIPVARHDYEKDEGHPVYKAFMDGRIGKTFSRDGVRKAVFPADMGLIKQCDDQMGRVFGWLKDTGR